MPTLLQASMRRVPAGAVTFFAVYRNVYVSHKNL